MHRSNRFLVAVLAAAVLLPLAAVPADATHGDSADEMFFYRDDGLYRYYNVDQTGSVGSPILAGDEYTTGWTSITAVDLDGDSADEMFFYRDDGLFRYYDVDGDGTIGAPIRAGDNYTQDWSSITAVDLDGDGQDEMFFYRDDGLFRYYDINPDGSLGSPLRAGDNYTTGWSSISAVDLDGDGQDEMFFYRNDGLFRYYDVGATGNVGSPIRAGDSYTSGWSAITAVDLDDTASDRGFHPFTVSGTGNDVFSFSVPGDVPAILDISYSGSGHFSVTSLDGSFENIDLLVNEIGAYEGRRMVHGGWLFEKEPVRALGITSSGSWTITARPMSHASAFSASLSGSGDDVVLYRGSASTLTSTHNGSSNFAIVGYEGDGEYNGLIVNEIGSYSGTDLIDTGSVIFDIRADGDWTLHAP